MLTKESYHHIFEKHSSTVQKKKKDFGIFMEFRDKFLSVSNPMIGHNGSDPGVFTAMHFNPVTNTGKVIHVNKDTDYSDQVWPEIINIWKSLSEYEFPKCKSLRSFKFVIR